MEYFDGHEICVKLKPANVDGAGVACADLIDGREPVGSFKDVTIGYLLHHRLLVAWSCGCSFLQMCDHND